ncbi:MAG: TMEM43 family protein [Kiritimatiellia bacterium]
MAVEEFKEVHKANWLERMGGSFKGIATGFVMIAAGVGLLFWNEGRAVKTAKALDEGSGAVVSVAADKVDPANEGKLVHVSGKADTQEMLEDAELGIKMRALRLSRTVEIFQWVEHSETETVKKGDKEYEKTTYTYRQEWCEKPVDSSSFKEAGHGNPPVEMPYVSMERAAKDVRLGAFRLSSANIRRVGGWAAYTFPEGYKIPETVKNGQLALARDAVYVPAQKVAAPATTVGSPLLAAAQNAVSNAVDAATRTVASNPQVGDLRIRVRVIEPHDVSICQKQVGESFAGWKSSNGQIIDLQKDGVATAEEMFESAKSSNSIMTWVLRVVGFILLLSGFKGVFGPIATLVDVIPVLGSLVAAGVGLISGLLAGIIWLVTVGLAWIFYRPVLGVSLLAAAAVLVVLLVMKRKKAPAAV